MLGYASFFILGLLIAFDIRIFKTMVKIGIHLPKNISLDKCFLKLETPAHVCWRICSLFQVHSIALVFMFKSYKNAHDLNMKKIVKSVLFSVRYLFRLCTLLEYLRGSIPWYISPQS